VERHFHPTVRVPRDEEKCDYPFCPCFCAVGIWQKIGTENGNIMQAHILNGKKMAAYSSLKSQIA
jgi:hypothetical protein